MIHIEGQPLKPGQRQRIRMKFLSGETATKITSAAGKFYLWEGRFIGEAISIGEDETAGQSK